MPHRPALRQDGRRANSRLNMSILISSHVLPHRVARRNNFVNASSGPVPLGHRQPHSLALLLNLSQHGRLVEPYCSAAFHQDLSIDDDRLHIASASAFDQRGDWIADGAIVQLKEVDDNDVSLRAHSDSPDVLATD